MRAGSWPQTKTPDHVGGKELLPVLDDRNHITTAALHDALRAACAEVGIVDRDVPADGRWHKTDIDGDPRGRGDGRIKLFPDGEGGIVCNWKGEIRPFFVDDGRKLTGAERRDRERKRAESIRRAREEEARRRAAGAMKASAIWKAAKPALRDHPYLTRKQTQAHGARLYRGPMVIDGMPCEGSLIVPACDGIGAIHTLLFIHPETRDGDNKRFLPRGDYQGRYFSIGTMEGAEPLCLCEGYATGASIHEATSYPVVVAFNAGNLLPVAKAMRERFPELHLIVCADDDVNTPGNPGLTKATAAADTVGGTVAVPDFGKNRPEAATDFNDLHRHAGLQAVVACIAAVAAGEDRGRNGADKAAGNCEAEGAAVQDPEWPHPMDPRAYYGLAGEMVKAIEPHTESDPAALLIQILVAFGVLIGRTPYFQVEGDRHFSNLFALLMGGTSKGRKGTSWGRVRSIFERVLGWLRVASGLSSGEGLKWQVRDPPPQKPKKKKRLKRRDYFDEEDDDELEDLGVSDKRLLVIEPEFAGVTRVVARQGNTLSATARSAWDTGKLTTLTKHDPITATGAHIAIIGHVTVDELRAELTQTDTANGFANRFLFLCVTRSKCLPFGGEALSESVVTDFARRLERAATAARRVSRVTMTEAARRDWERVYPSLSEGKPGLFGAATARAEAQVVRLAMIYALLDEKAQIEVPHLRAALSVWEYCEASAQYVFGASLGDPVADEILRAVRAAGQEGITRTQISGLFHRNYPAGRIGAALDLLARLNLAKKVLKDTGGRPCEVWVRP